MYKKIKLQRYPFDFIDSLLSYNQTSCRTLKNISQNEWTMFKHDQESVYWPWWALVESMAQTAGRFDEYLRAYQQRVMLTKMKCVKWEFLAKPGDRVMIEATLVKRHDILSVFHVVAMSDNKAMAEGDFFFAPVK